MPRPFTITLPIADRRRAHTFYREGLELDPVGDAAPDGLPEPLQFRLFGEAYLCLVPTEGFDWVLGDRALSSAGHSECLLGLAFSDDDVVSAVTQRLIRAGGTVLNPPAHRPWGFESLVADPDGHAWQLYVGGTRDRPTAGDALVHHDAGRARPRPSHSGTRPAGQPRQSVAPTPWPLCRSDQQ